MCDSNSYTEMKRDAAEGPKLDRYSMKVLDRQVRLYGHGLQQK